jgi:RND family efflux transporter MFP subunit
LTVRRSKGNESGCSGIESGYVIVLGFPRSPMNASRKLLLAVIVLLALGGVAFFWWRSSGERSGREGDREARPAPVAVARAENGPIALRRTLSGTLEAHSEFLVAPKVGGRVRRLMVDLADPVGRNEVVLELDDAEFVQEVLRAEADLAVAEANLAQARSLQEISEREIERFNTLRDRGFTSASQYETAEADRLAREAQWRVAQAQLQRAEAALASARIRLDDTRVKVEWSGSGEERLVAERFVDEGDTISANDPVLRVVEIDPLMAVIHVTERDYALIERGQAANFETDALPGEVFTGQVERVSPVFREATRQARVELALENPRLRLKPGMFVRVSLTLAQKDDALIIPATAITRRRGEDGVFVVEAEGTRVRWAPVRVGIRDGARAEVEGLEAGQRVVVLGQQLVEDGSAIVIAEEWNEERVAGGVS